jgi:hypothetical protein
MRNTVAKRLKRIAGADRQLYRWLKRLWTRKQNARPQESTPVKS